MRNLANAFIVLCLLQGATFAQTVGPNPTASILSDQVTGPISGINVNTEIRMIDALAGGFSVFGCNHTDPTLRCYASDIPTDTYNRFIFDGNGKFGWGDGVTSSADVHLSRTAAKTLTADNYFIVAGPGLASTAPLLVNGTILTGGTGVTNWPQLLVQPSGTTSSTWNTSGTLFGANGPTGFGGNLFDFQILGTSIISGSSSGNMQMTGFITVGSGGAYILSGRSLMSSAADGTMRFLNNAQTNSATISFPSATATPTFQFGALDAAAPIAQTIGIQNVVAGTSNVAGANAIINLSRGTGTGIGGNLTINGAPHSTTGSTQNSLAAVLILNGDTKAVTVGGTLSATLTNVASTSAVCFNTGTGLMTYDGTIGTCTVSDERLKNMGERIPHALDRLLQINGVYYTWKDPSLGSGRQIGVGAQTVEKVFPELVQTDSNGRKSADYQRLTAPIIEALRELKADNDNLRREMAELKRSRQ